MINGPLEKEGLAQELAALLNKHSQEHDSGTPDFVLAEFLLGCLTAWNIGIVQRQAWYGIPVEGPSEKPAVSLPYDPPHGEPVRDDG